SNGSNSIPRNIHRHKDIGPPYARATRFYHNTAALYAAGTLDELVADPFQALPVAPAGTAALAGKPQNRASLPVFKPELCTACGACMVHCPHEALPSLAINVEQLLRGGMEIAAKLGTPLAQLTPLVKNLGKIAGQIIQEKAEPIGRLGDFLPEAFNRLADQLNLEGEKRTSTEQQIEKLIETLKPLPIAATQKLFNQREAMEGGSGELFALALDSQACTGCGICSTVCEPLALEMTPQTPELAEQAAATLECWEQLPDTAPASILRLLDDMEYNPLAALLLSRFNYGTLAGPGPDELGPKKAMIHWLTAIAESIGQPNLAAMCREIEQAASDLSENIHQVLGEALPAENSSGLQDAIRDADGKRLPLDELIVRLSAQEHLKLIDTAVLQRKTQLAQALKDLLWTLKEGPTGMGRARYGLVFPGGEQAAESLYPFHAFQAPAMVTADGSLDLSLGLFEAQLRHAIDNIRLLRRAKLEIKNQYRPELHAATIAGLTWDQLTDAEKNLAPPLLVVCNRENLPENFIGQLPKVLASKYPMKIIVLDNGALQPNESPEIYFGTRNAMLQAAQSCRQATVFMGSAANPKVFFEGLLRGMRSHEPAFFLLYCPDSRRHNLPLTAWPQLAERALNSRAVPFFEVNPAQHGGNSRASAISLRGNPSERAGWAFSAKNDDSMVVTFADWLFTLDDWREYFQEQKESPANACQIAEYLDLDAAARVGKTPVIFPFIKNGVSTSYAVSENVAQACGMALSAWNDLREMAGALSPHPEKLWQEAETEIASRYEARIREIEAAHAARVEQLEQEFLEKTRIKLREKLLALSKNSD
ncbi:MAG: 4Fe-4S binding protein, partial [Lewinellaceae bacterium]|nr:4Fe-4S binding protein [Lewinellaceae bacterium]